MRICEDNQSINYWFVGQQSKVHMMSHTHDVSQVHCCTVKTKLVIKPAKQIASVLWTRYITIHKSIQIMQTVSRRIKWSSYGLCMHSQLPNSFLLDFFYWSLHLDNVLSFWIFWSIGQINNTSLAWVWFALQVVQHKELKCVPPEFIVSFIPGNP